MNFKPISLIIRILIAVGLGYFLMRFLLGGASAGELDPAAKIFGLLLFAIYGGVLFLLFGIPFLRYCGEKVSGFYMPSEDHFPIRPEYSLAEARLKAGQYDAAIAEYRQVIEKFPDDVYAHVQIAKIAAEFLGDQRLAEAELLTASAKAVSEDALLLTHNRLADHYHVRLKNTQRAIEVIQQLRGKVGPAAAQRIDERLLALQAASGKNAPGDPPAKIIFRPADEETMKKRRGY